MAYELRDGQGSLFQNKYKEAGDNRPGLTGTIMIEGREYKISAWKKQGSNGRPWFYSLSIKPADEQTTGSSRRQEPQRTNDWDPNDGDIPF